MGAERRGFLLHGGMMPSMPRLSASFGTVRCHLGAPFIGPARKTVRLLFTGIGVGDLMTTFIGWYSLHIKT